MSDEIEEKSKAFNVRLPYELWRSIKICSAMEDLSINDIVKTGLQKHINNWEKRKAAKEQ